MNVKDKPRKEKISNVVYGIKCGSENCSETYVGETKQALGTRMGQHKRPSTIEAQNSAVFNHLRSSGHSFDLGDVKILDKEENWSRRGIKEAVWERIESPSLTRKEVYGLCCRTRGTVRYQTSRVSYHVTLMCHKLTRQNPEEGRVIWPKRRSFIYISFS